MSIFASPRFLRYVLLADAASCLVTGAIQVSFTVALSQVLQLPAALLAGTGWFLLIYGGAVAWFALREHVPRALAWALVGGNLGWAVACLALLAGGWVAPSVWGVAWVLAQAATVGVLAELQWTALRRTRRVGWA